MKTPKRGHWFEIGPPEDDEPDDKYKPLVLDILTASIALAARGIATKGVMTGRGNKWHGFVPDAALPTFREIFSKHGFFSGLCLGCGGPTRKYTMCRKCREHDWKAEARCPK